MPGTDIGILEYPDLKESNTTQMISIGLYLLKRQGCDIGELNALARDTFFSVAPTLGLSNLFLHPFEAGGNK